VEAQINELLKLGIIKPSKSEMGSPIVCVLKGKDGKDGVRIAVDYRYLNKYCEGDAYPMPEISDLIQKVGKSKIITLCDYPRTRIININTAHRSAVRSCPPVIICNRSFVVNQPTVRERYLTCLQRTPLLSPVKVGVFNARSVSKKSESIAAWVADLNLTAAGLVETWHDGPDTPSLVACAPPGYIYLERARPRSADQACNMSTNHGGVCLLYRDRLHARLVNTTQYTTFEHIIDNHSAFRRGLKTHLFHFAF